MHHTLRLPPSSWTTNKNLWDAPIQGNHRVFFHSKWHPTPKMRDRCLMVSSSKNKKWLIFFAWDNLDFWTWPDAFVNRKFGLMFGKAPEFLYGLKKCITKFWLFQVLKKVGMIEAPRIFGTYRHTLLVLCGSKKHNLQRSLFEVGLIWARPAWPLAQLWQGVAFVGGSCPHLCSKDPPSMTYLGKYVCHAEP